MVNAQEYLDTNYPKETRNQITELDISKQNLIGELDFKDLGFTNLEKVDVSYNSFEKISFAGLEPNKLVLLNMENTWGRQPWQEERFNLSSLSHFHNLKELYVANAQIEGKAKDLKDMGQLEYFSYGGEDIMDDKLCNEHLDDNQFPFSVRKIYWGNKNSPSGTRDYEDKKNWIEKGFDRKEIEQWTKIGLRSDQWDFADYLKSKSHRSTDTNLDLKDEYQNWLVESGKEVKTYTLRKLQEKVKQGKIDRRANVKVKSKNNRVVTMLVHVPDNMWNRIELTEGRWEIFGSALWGKILAFGNEDAQKLIKDDGTFVSKEILEQFKKFSDGEREIEVRDSTTGQTNQVKIKDSSFSLNCQFDHQEIITALTEDGKIFGGGDYGYAFQNKEAFQFMKHIVGTWINSISLLKDKEFSFQEIVDLRSAFSTANYRNNYLVEVEIEPKASENELDSSIPYENEQQEKLSAKMVSQIKNFSNYWNLAPRQKSLVDELIQNKELKRKYKAYGLCQECYQPNSEYNWCQFCNAQRFQEEFSKWTSGDLEIDGFIQKHQLESTSNWQALEWIPYHQFKNIEYLAKGGFGEIYKASWTEGYISSWNVEDNKWQRGYGEYGELAVALKSLNNSQNITANFFQEVANHKLFGDGPIVKCYGISQNPETKNYLMVLDYIPSGDLRKYLKDNYREMSFENKFAPLQDIASGLKYIHKKKLVHKDFHPGNILSSKEEASYTHSFVITDLGLSRPADEKEKKEERIFGVLPYVAPEVLQGKGYTRAADIYSWSMIAYEVLTGLSPYYNLEHDIYLASKVCEGKERPKFNIKIPELLEDLIRKCWDKDPTQRPSAKEVEKILENWYFDINDSNDTEFYQQHLVAEEHNEKLSDEIRFPEYECPSMAYTSKLINTKQITELLQKFEQVEYSKSLAIDFTAEDNQTEQEENIVQQEVPPKGNN